MLEQILPAWRARRVLLAGGESRFMCAMDAQLTEIGARPVRVSFPADCETLCRRLHEGRFACVIVPDLARLCTGNAQDRMSALDMLLGEAQEAGVPLAILLSSLTEDAPLLRRAEGFMHGACGDPVSMQCILHAGGDTSIVCSEALLLGARFLAGEQSCTGVFDLRKRPVAASLSRTSSHA